MRAVVDQRQHDHLSCRLAPRAAFGQPGNVQLNSDPRTRRHLRPDHRHRDRRPQRPRPGELPTDHYAVVVLAGDNGGPSVIDLAGNRSDGEFNGVFPSGRTARRRERQHLHPGSWASRRLAVADHHLGADWRPAIDTGIGGDENTNFNQPLFVGQVTSNFPGTLAGLTVLAEFNSLHGGNLDLAPGPDGRGFIGSFDAVATTDANGHFTIQAPFLPEGFNRVRLVVIGQPDSPPLPGLSSAFDHSFRIDNTTPFIYGSSLPNAFHCLRV